MQFLAPFDSEQLLCESVSAKSVPEVATILTPKKEKILYSFGFEPAGISPNYSQGIHIGSDGDFGYVTRLAFRVLKQVYEVTSFAAGKFNLSIPASASDN
jgi:hypothetical protein